MPADAARFSTRPSDRQIVALLAGFEWRLQTRDFLAWMSALVFLLLTLGYSANGVIALVNDRGDIPRHAPWALAHAMAGVTAFGQVITAMVAATTVLRDVGLRTQPLLLTSGISWRTYLSGRFAGTLTVLVAIYAMIPLGLLAGHLGALASHGDAIAPLRLSAYAWPTLVLVLPNVLLVAAAFFAVGAMAGRFGPILLLGIGFIGLWQSGLALVQRDLAWGVLVDPFGNAALVHITRAWSVADRASLEVSADAWLIANRLLWLGIAAVVGGWTLVRWRPALADGTARVTGTAAVTGTARGVTTEQRGASRALQSLPPLRGTSVLHQFAAEARFGLRWVLRERGALALVGLAALNALANGWALAATAGPPLLGAIEFHARLFGILIATIYAGELVWRDRDTRADALLAALPASNAVRLAGRATGVGLVLAALPLTLLLVAVGLPLLRGGPVDAWCAARWLLGTSLPQFWGLLVISLLVHAIVQHKTVAHLLLIAAWVLAIALGVRALATPWAGYGVC
jgi:ABC-type transport system involved in multi-copper enzyme maturation permease subunit